MSDALKFRYKRIAERIDKMSLRERVMVFVASIAVLLFVLGQLWVLPQWRAQLELSDQIEARRMQLEAMQMQRDATTRAQGQNQDQNSQERLAMLNQRLQEMDPALAGVTRSLVSPKEMARLVEDVLRRNRNLQLVRVESLPPEPLVEPASAPEAADPVPADPAADVPTDSTPKVNFTGFYKHGMRIEVRGKYFDLVNYLRSLEKLPWKVFWGQVNLETEEYPVSRLTLVVYTLSLRQGWIGI